MYKHFNEKIHVRFADLDAYGHVNNAVFFTYLETARTNVFREVFNSLMQRGVLLIVVKAECDYLKPITLTDSVYVSFNISGKGKTSFNIEYEINDGASTTYATAKTTMVCLDNNSDKPIKVPEELSRYISD